MTGVAGLRSNRGIQLKDVGSAGAGGNKRTIVKTEPPDEEGVQVTPVLAAPRKGRPSKKAKNGVGRAGRIRELTKKYGVAALDSAKLLVSKDFMDIADNFPSDVDIAAALENHQNFIEHWTIPTEDVLRVWKFAAPVVTNHIFSEIAEEENDCWLPYIAKANTNSGIEIFKQPEIMDVAAVMLGQVTLASEEVKERMDEAERFEEEKLDELEADIDYSSYVIEYLIKRRENIAKFKEVMAGKIAARKRRIQLLEDLEAQNVAELNNVLKDLTPTPKKKATTAEALTFDGQGAREGGRFRLSRGIDPHDKGGANLRSASPMPIRRSGDHARPSTLKLGRLGESIKIGGGGASMGKERSKGFGFVQGKETTSAEIDDLSSRSFTATMLRNEGFQVFDDEPMPEEKGASQGRKGIEDSSEDDTLREEDASKDYY
ncbi:hypothetical protein BDZ91DRAFT_766648 [Kalaharituber pfeilii]|nr:hypothetical protein BDZ91DRAFT_766648 [Kalaharituber pfeilii]